MLHWTTKRLFSKAFKNYRSNQAIKLIEINSRYNLFKPGNKVIDLGSAPGGWSQVAQQKTNSTEQNTSVFSIDFDEMQPIEGCRFIQGDIMDKELRAELVEILDMRPVDIILCDLDFVRENDQDRNSLKMTVLNKQAVDLSLKLLKPGGTLLMKTLRGAFEPSFKQTLGLLFMDFQVVNTMSLGVVDDLSELYYLGQGFQLTDSFTKYKPYFQKYFAERMQEIQDHEIPPEITSQEQMVQQILEFLRDAEEKQFLVESDLIDEIKQHPQFADLDWSKLNLNITKERLTEEERQEIFELNTRGKFTFNPKQFESMEEINTQLSEYQRKVKELKQYRRKRDSMLLQEEEVLGENELPAELKEFAEQMQPAEKRKQDEGELRANQVKMGKLMFEEHFYGMDEHEIRKKLEAEQIGLESFQKKHINDVLRVIGVEREIKNSEKLSEELVRNKMKDSERRTKEYRNQYYQKDSPFGRKIK